MADSVKNLLILISFKGKKRSAHSFPFLDAQITRWKPAFSYASKARFPWPYKYILNLTDSYKVILAVILEPVLLDKMANFKDRFSF